MSNSVKKHGFSIHVARLFTQPGQDAYDLIHFKEPDQQGDETFPALECPDNWSAEAAGLLAQEAACSFVPKRLTAIEENTVPSWLWRRTGDNSGDGGAETSVRPIFDRVGGGAAYTGWKEGLFANEAAARAFYDEARYMLAQRFIAFEPHILAALGLDWAYGIAGQKTCDEKLAEPSGIAVPNSMVDAIIGGSRDKNIRAQWQRIVGAKTKPPSATLHFSDIESDWGTQERQSMRVALDLMAFRHNDGLVNSEALRHATRVLTILLDLHGLADESLSIGFCNMAPLLMALALPYESEAARATASAIAAVITAQAYATSAELAALRGPGAAFGAAHETTRRALRNHRRAAYGERNDYEKISVLPAPLVLEACPDLALAAFARNGWDEALDLSQKHGLRSRTATTLSISPALTLFMESTAQGIEPLRALIAVRTEDGEHFQRSVHDSVTEGLTRLGYDQAHSQKIIRYVAGIGHLDKAPAINHAALRALGFDGNALKRLEDYLPQVDDIRLAFTPWILGEEFCRKVLKVPQAKIGSARFDLLKHLGFSAADIAAANIYCYGHDSVRGAHDLKPRHASVFARADEIAPDMQIRMAAAVQSFISGEVGLDLSLPADMPAETVEKLLLGAWRQGVKSMTIDYIAPAQNDAREKTAREIRPSVYAHAKSPGLPARAAKPKAKSGLAGIGRPKPKSSRRGWNG